MGPALHDGDFVLCQPVQVIDQPVNLSLPRRRVCGDQGANLESGPKYDYDPRSSSSTGKETPAMANCRACLDPL